VSLLRVTPVILSLALVACAPNTDPAGGLQTDSAADRADTGLAGSDDGGEDTAGGDDTDGADTAVDTGDEAGGDTADDEGGDDDLDPLALRAAGPYAATTSTGSVATASGCALAWKTWTPDSPSVGRVVLAHGFMRSADQFADWGAHLASWGVTATTASLCHSTILDVDPVANAEDLVALVAATGGGSALYIGHSNGGISALLAGVRDPNAVGVLGLDPVESYGGDSAGVAAGATLAVGALLGESGLCNDSNSGQAVFAAAPGAQLLRVSGADHCDFEAPTDATCTSFCNSTGSGFSDDEVRGTVRALVAGFALWRLAGSTAGEAWWTPGTPTYQDALNTGAISAP
jgi:pimeloyl-ACP methyl ester carboxylesterase